MPASVYRLFVPLVILGLLLLVVFKLGSTKQTTRQTIQKKDESQLDPSRFLIRPFYSQGTEIALALDGGAIPVAGGQVPSIMVGKNLLRTVHLAWLHDWSKPETLALFKNLQVLYASEEGTSLPALKIYLNPVFSDPAGEALHRAMLQVFFRGDTRDSYLKLAREMSTGALPANAQAIRKRIEITDPILIADWDNRLEWLESDIEKTLSTARIQQARNAAITPTQDIDQLTSMLATLSPLANPQELSAFIQNANATQRAWLQTLETPHVAAPVVR